MNYNNVPIYIISFNRLHDLKLQINRLVQDGYQNIHIIDNHSTDRELIDFLKECSYRVYFMDKNYGHRVFWECGLFDEVFRSQYYVVTDPDVIPVEDCPGNYIEHFYQILQLYPQKRKSGFSLRLDDLPVTFTYRMDVIRWESQWFDKILSYDPLLYEAEIDTTFALYRPGTDPPSTQDAIRTGKPYIARHLGWYLDLQNLSEKERSYLDSGALYGNSYSRSDRVGFYRKELILRLMDLDREENKQIFLEIWSNFANCIRDIYLYGAGEWAKNISRILLENGIPIKGILVTKLSSNHPVSVNNIPVYSIDDATLDKKQDGIILAMNNYLQLEVLKLLYQKGFLNICHL